MVYAPMLEIYDGSSDTKVETYTDATSKSLGAVLLQKYAAADHFHPIAYYCKKLNNA